jgi:hypothetical protein
MFSASESMCVVIILKVSDRKMEGGTFWGFYFIYIYLVM